MICGLVLKYLNMSGLVMIGRYETTLPCTSQFPLTLPFGKVVARICNLEFSSDQKQAKQIRSRVSKILRKWEANGWIKCGETHDSRTGRTVKFYEAGDVHPNEV